MADRRHLADMLWHYHFFVEAEGWLQPAFMQEINAAGDVSGDEQGIALGLLESLRGRSNVESIDDLRDILRDHYSDHASAVHRGPTEQESRGLEETCRD